MRELDALQAECERVEATLRAVPDDAWSRPGLGEWSLHELGVHVVRGVGRLATYLAQEAGGEPGHDRVSYFRYDADATAAAVADRARREAAELPPHEVAMAFAHTWRDSITRAAEHGPVHVMPTIFGPMHVQEYVATRVLEMVVHHMDLRRALDLAPDPDPGAADLVAGILEALLDGPRPRNLGRDRFILVCTGRIPHDDPRFPVMR